MGTTTSSDTVADRARWLATTLGRADLSPASADEMADLAEAGVELEMAGGTIVFRQGEMPDHVYVLRSGTVELSRRLQGREVTLKRLRAGDPFGDVPLLLRDSEPFDARAVDDCVVLSFESVALYGLLGRNPALARRWLVSVADRMRETQERVSDLLSGSLDGQIASLLLHQPEHTMHVSQDALARLLGARRTSVNQALGRMQAEGLIETAYRRVRATDSARLAAVVTGEQPGISA